MENTLIINGEEYKRVEKVNKEKIIPFLEIMNQQGKWEPVKKEGWLKLNPKSAYSLMESSKVSFNCWRLDGSLKIICSEEDKSYTEIIRHKDLKTWNLEDLKKEMEENQ